MKKCNDNQQPVFDPARHRCKRGASSFNMHDSELVFQKIKLKPSQIFADFGSGAGEYSLRAAEIVGPQGLVLSVDCQDDLIQGLNEEAFEKGLKNIKTIKGDLCQKLDISSETADVCMIATAMHREKITPHGQNVLKQAFRILRSKGVLAIIECKKEKMPFGPPLSMRVSREELCPVVENLGFKEIDYADLGFNYLVIYQKSN